MRLGEEPAEGGSSRARLIDRSVAIVVVVLALLCVGLSARAEDPVEPGPTAAGAEPPGRAPAASEAEPDVDDARDLEDALEGEPRELDEARHGDVKTIRVTGRRREEILQEVPVSIRAFDAAELSARNVTRIDEIGFGTANLTFDSTNGSNRNARIYIRGIGQDDPRTIVDPAIGIYIDNVYIPRATNALFDVVDFERVEVLRGPQGTLYGKNTVGGVINIVTTKPGTEFGGYADLNFGSFDLFEFRGAVDAPVDVGWFEDKLFTRLSVAAATEDGYTKNLLTGEDAGDNKLLAVRGSARLMPIDGLIADLVLEWQRQGERSVIGKCLPGNPFNIARYVTDNFVGSGPGDRYLDWCQRSIAAGPFAGYASPLRKTTTDTVGTSLQLEYHLPDRATGLADFVTVKSITGYRRRLDENTGGDADGTPLDYIAQRPGTIEHWAVSEDLNFNLAFWDERVDVILGGYFFREEGDELGGSAILTDMAIGNNASFNAETYPNTVQVLNALLAPAQGLPQLPQGAWYAIGLANSPSDPTDDRGDTFWRNAVRWGIGELNFERSQVWANTSYAAYAHVDVEVVPEVTLQGGIRYTDEEKTRQGYDRRIYFSQLNTDLTMLPLTIDPPMNPPGLGTIRVVLPQSVDFSQLTPEAGIKWQMTDEHMTYFRYARGWKSGGLRVEALTETEAAARSPRFLAPYRPEEVDSFEVGVKTQWFEDQVFLNATLFWNDYRDLQVTSLEPDERGIVTALINNAESAVTRGFEIEGSYVPDWAEKIPVTGSMLLFNAGIGFTDAYYKTFFGTETPPITDVQDCPSLVRGITSPTGVDCDLVVDTFAIGTLLGATRLIPLPSPTTVDLSGNDFKNTPRLNINASLTYGFSPTTDLEIALRADWSYRSTIYYTTINQPDLASGPLHLLNLSAAVDVVPSRTQVVFWVKNVTDEVTVSGALSLGAALGADALFYSKPRTFGMRLVQRF